MLEIGSLVDGKYKILNKIGQGGMSVVYLAMNEKANKPWAVKEVRKDGLKDFEVVKQGLIAETEILKKLSHPNLPSIVDVIEEEDTFIIVMDYIEGNPLSKVLEEFGALPQEYVVEWAKQLCDVLGYLHSRNPPIIYRDMKPANIMLKPDGNITLIDFGTAREFKEKNVADTTCLGTIGYAAPEQFGGQGQTDARTDIYNLGATLYHLVTGCNPSEPPYEIRPIRQINPNLSSGLEKIIEKCTQRNPDDRYQSCAELMYDLEHYEEIDDEYKKRQKRKMGVFLVSAALTLLFAATGFIGGHMAKKLATDNYLTTIAEAEKTPDLYKKVEIYKEAITIKPEEKDAYLGLIDTFKKGDDVFTTEEENILIKQLKNNKKKLESDKEQYANICFEVGKLYWYYYSYGDGADNKITRMTAAIPWFDDAILYGGPEYEHRGMAVIYRDIGIFYRDIAINTVEANEKGLFEPFWHNLNELLHMTGADSDESEIVKLELLELTRSAIHQYATKFKADGISKEDMLNTLNMVKTNVTEIEATTEKTQAMKANIENNIDEAIKAVDTAFRI